MVDKQELERNYYDRMYENCHISASMAPRHLRTGHERAYTTIYHKIILFLSRSNCLAIIWLEIVTKHYDELCDIISRKLIAIIKNGFSGHYISTQAEAVFSLLFK